MEHQTSPPFASFGTQRITSLLATMSDSLHTPSPPPPPSPSDLIAPMDLSHIGPSAPSSQATADAKSQNQVSTVVLHGVSIVSLLMDGIERLCLAQISNTLLKDYSYNEIHNRRVALGITCIQCTPVQLEVLRRAGAMPISSRRCGMITKREAERLVKSFLEEHTPPKLPENFAFSVYHTCGWGCKGHFVPSRYNSSRAKCIKCLYCATFFSPNKFIFHFHRTPEAKYRHPDAANFNSWRRHLELDPAQNGNQEEINHAWEDVKAMFNGGSRKRLAPETSSTPSMVSPPSKSLCNSRLPDTTQCKTMRLHDMNERNPFMNRESSLPLSMPQFTSDQMPLIPTHPVYPPALPCSQTDIPKPPPGLNLLDLWRARSSMNPNPFGFIWPRNVPMIAQKTPDSFANNFSPDFNSFMRRKPPVDVKPPSHSAFRPVHGSLFDRPPVPLIKTPEHDEESQKSEDFQNDFESDVDVCESLNPDDVEEPSKTPEKFTQAIFPGMDPVVQQKPQISDVSGSSPERDSSAINNNCESTEDRNTPLSNSEMSQEPKHSVDNILSMSKEELQMELLRMLRDKPGSNGNDVTLPAPQTTSTPDLTSKLS